MNPEIELVAGTPAAEALKEIAADVNGEATFLCHTNAIGADRAGTTPLRTALDDGLVAEKFQHLADGDPLSDCRIVELAHDLRPLVPPLLVVLRRTLRAARCSAR